MNWVNSSQRKQHQWAIKHLRSVQHPNPSRKYKKAHHWNSIWATVTMANIKEENDECWLGSGTFMYTSVNIHYITLQYTDSLQKSVQSASKNYKCGWGDGLVSEMLTSQAEGQVWSPVPTYKSQAQQCKPAIPALGKARQESIWDFLVSQSCQINELQVQWENVPQKRRHVGSGAERTRGKITCCTSIRNRDPSNHINNQDAAVHSCCPVWQKGHWGLLATSLASQKNTGCPTPFSGIYMHAHKCMYLHAYICTRTHTTHKKRRKRRAAIEKDWMSISDFLINAHMCICIHEWVHMNTYTKI